MNNTRVDPSTGQAWVRLKHLCRLLWNYRVFQLLGMAILLGSTLLGVAQPILNKWFVDGLVDGIPWHQLRLFGLLMVGLLCLQGALYSFQGYLFTLTGARAALDLRKQLFDHLHRLTPAFYARNTVGDLVARIWSDVAIIESSLRSIMAVTAADLLLLLCSLVIVTILDWRLSLLVILTIPAFVLNSGLMGQRLRIVNQSLRSQVGIVTGFLVENLGAVGLIQSLRLESYQSERFVSLGKGLVHMSIRLGVLQAIGGWLAGFFGHLGPILVMFYGGYEIIMGRLTLGTVVAVVSYMGMLYAPISRLSQLGINIRTLDATLERVYSLMDVQPDIIERRDAISPLIEGST